MGKSYKIRKFFIILLIILLIIITLYYNTIRMNTFVFLAVTRGILAPNCFWWDISDTLLKNDNNGIHLYKECKDKHGNFAPINIFGTKMILPTQVDHIQQILDHSPNIFSVGKFKYNFFKTFMKYNVGISSGCPWKSRRVLNEKVLVSNYIHKYSNYYNQAIKDLLVQNIPQNFKEFKEISKKVVARVVFNRKIIPKRIFKVFSNANSVRAVINKNYKLPPKLTTFFRNYIWNELRFPQPLSLISLCKDTHLTKDELIDQVPHWIFPIGGLIHTNVPRVLSFICNAGYIDKLRKELRLMDLTDATAIYEATFLRQCILETLRLNNPVTSTFRTLSKPFTFNNGPTFPIGTQFVILNNGIMREHQCFYQPNRFIPERWTPDMEKMYCSLMFNQGPQNCPGKELAIFIMSSFIAHYLRLSGVLDYEISLNCTDIKGQIINPCKLAFTFKSLRKN